MSDAQYCGPGLVGGRAGVALAGGGDANTGIQRDIGDEDRVVRKLVCQSRWVWVKRYRSTRSGADVFRGRPQTNATRMPTVKPMP
jgi:hypothetical protein